MTTLETKHEDLIHDVQFDYFGKRMATCSSDKTIKIFDVSTSKPRLLSELKGHEGPVWQVTWAHPSFGNILASCSFDHKVIIWKEVSNIWTQIKSIQHKSSVNSISWGPHENGLILATASSDGSITIAVFKNDKWYEYYKQNAHQNSNTVSWSPSFQLASGGGDNLVKIWNFTNDELLFQREFKDHTDWVRDVSWSPSVGLPYEILATCSQDKTVHIYKKTKDSFDQVEKLSFSSTVWRLSWSITGNVLAVSTADNLVSLYKESLEGKWTKISTTK